MATFLLCVAIFGTITGLYIWAQRRARALREQSARREQSAMALMLAGGQLDEERPPESDTPVKPKVMGRLLDDDPAEKAAAAARHAAARSVAKEKTRELPPLEYGSKDSKSRSKSKSNGAHNGAHRAAPVEHAADGMDPIEDLISQIMVHEPEQHTRPRSAAKPAPASNDAVAKRKPDVISPNVPLRELVLAWYEARGYRGSPASPAVWPIELVLRHREDAARAYAFVVQNDHVSVDRITALIEQAREIGMMRVAVIAEAGYESGAKEVAKRRHVRLIDRPAMEAELSELQLPTAAKIIAIARKRSAEASPA
ncbi:MAG TPA: hypothetical protein VM937_13880 [Burkholderiaceae bacterium]|nr:hypothetical protein [Burkholderiaceae bacterium]